MDRKRREFTHVKLLKQLLKIAIVGYSHCLRPCISLYCDLYCTSLIPACNWNRWFGLLLNTFINEDDAKKNTILFISILLNWQTCYKIYLIRNISVK